MDALLIILRPLQRLNDLTGRVGLLQVFCRYVLNNALPWPDEAARFMMLWLTGLMAPVAFRHGGMVAITGVLELLPRQLVSAFSLLLLVTSLAVLVVGAQLGLKHVDSGWLFSSSSLKLPLFLIGMKSVKIKLAWMYMSLLVGVWLMILVNIELILRSVVVALGGASRLRPVQMPGQSAAEAG
ncbi:MAG: TRAP transporter small permease subunit [Alphaproteobacteria bacterium]|nr:TRAP transporter small permease subunit [Alphaproteobacteria bacterium]